MVYEETRQNKTFDKERTPQKSKQPNDSKTVDVSLFRRIRKHDSRLTIRINKRFKELIKRHCTAKGLSICHINDALWFGYLLGWNEKLDVDVKSPTINLTLVRDVKRVRRYAVEVEDDRCHFCGKEAMGMFRYKRTGKMYALCEFHAGEFVDGKNWEVVE
jgi:hypothetical protein